MAKFNVSYKIETVIDGTVKPGDELKGKCFIRNEESKTLKLKGINARISAFYNEDVWEEDFHTKDWALETKERKQTLKEYPIFQSDTKVEPGDTQEFDFVIKLPSFPGARPYGWYVALMFSVKSGMFSSGAKDADDATCILPVPGSTRMPNFGEIPGGPAVDPPRNPPPRPTGPTKSQQREERREEHRQNFSSSSSFEPASAPSRPSGGSRGGGMQCLKCHGSGQCKSCGGSGQKGRLQCVFCHGSGKCDWCGGTGSK